MIQFLKPQQPQVASEAKKIIFVPLSKLINFVFMLQSQNLLHYRLKQYLKPQQPQAASEAETSKLCLYHSTNKSTLFLCSNLNTCFVTK